jgi:hypothetical protein
MQPNSANEEGKAIQKKKTKTNKQKDGFRLKLYC